MSGVMRIPMGPGSIFIIFSIVLKLVKGRAI